jgi:hypothetical protein
VGVTRRFPWGALVDVLIPVTIVLFAFGSSSVAALLRIGTKGRWVALFALAGIAVAQLVVSGRRVPTPPVAWLVAAVLLVVGAESALWSVDPRVTVGRIFTVGVLFATAAALALSAPDPAASANRVLRDVLGGVIAVAFLSLVVLVLVHRDAVLPATTGAGWRFRGVGENPNTVPLLLAVGMPLSVWWWFERSHWAGAALVLLFAGEIAFSGSRGATIAGFGGALVTTLVLGRSAREKVAVAAGLCVLAVVCVEVGKIPQPVEPAAAAPAAQPPVKPSDARPRGINAQQTFRLEDEIGFPFAGAYRPPVPRTVFGTSGRAQAWDGALRQGAQRPLVGYGFGTEDRVFVDRFYSFEGGFVENSYLGLFLQVGAAGLALFVALLLTLAWCALRFVRRGPRAGLGPVAAASGVLIAAMLIGVTQSGLLSVGNIATTSIWLCVLVLPILARTRAA